MYLVYNADQHARKLLLAIYYYAKFLGVINCRLDKDQLKMYSVERSSKLISRTIRICLTVAYLFNLGNLFRPFVTDDESFNLISIFAALQAISLSFFAIFIAYLQTGCETRINQMLNEFMRLYVRILKRCRRVIILRGMLNRKFMLIFILKLITTLIGYVREIPALLNAEDLLAEGPAYMAVVFAGIYLWMGSMLVLDVCVLAFLIIGSMYEEMGKFLKRMLQRMRALEEAEDTDNKPMDKWGKLHAIHHTCMTFLCDCADIVADCDVIYADLYALTKQFQYLFQWQILYYVYYNFIVVLLLLHSCIWYYLHEDVFKEMDLLLVAVKITNLAILIMCADFVVQRAEMPKLLYLDIVFSDVDERWCMSVESFLSRRQVERLEIKVLGFFQLNNEFILIILSAIVSYLFIIIQFGLTDMKMTELNNAYV